MKQQKDVKLLQKVNKMKFLTLALILIMSCAHAASPVTFNVFVLKVKKEHLEVRHKGVNFNVPRKLVKSKNPAPNKALSLELGDDQWIQVKNIYMDALEKQMKLSKK